MKVEQLFVCHKVSEERKVPFDGIGPSTNPLKGRQNVKLRQPLELWSKRGQEDAFYMS